MDIREHIRNELAQRIINLKKDFDSQIRKAFGLQFMDLDDFHDICKYLSENGELPDSGTQGIEYIISEIEEKWAELVTHKVIDDYMRDSRMKLAIAKLTGEESTDGMDT